MKDDFKKNHMALCQCSSPEHMFVFNLFDWNHGLTKEQMTYNPECAIEMNLQVHMNPERSFWKRVWAAIRYVCGYRSRFGDFDDVMVQHEDVLYLSELFDLYKAKYKEYDEMFPRTPPKQEVPETPSEPSLGYYLDGNLDLGGGGNPRGGNKIKTMADMYDSNEDGFGGPTG